MPPSDAKGRGFRQNYSTGYHPRILRHGAVGNVFQENGKARYQRSPKQKWPGGVVKLFPARSVAMSARSSPDAHSCPLNIAQWLKNSHRSSITHLNLCDEMPPDQKLLTKMLITHKLALVNIFDPL